MLDLLKKLCAPIAVSGDESAVCEIIKSEVLKCCDSIHTDKMGNLICHKRGKTKSKNKIMIAAHMDEVGFVITDVLPSGLLKFALVGGVDARILPGKRVEILSNGKGVFGVIGTAAPHLISKAAAEHVLKEDELFINIGVDSKQDALKLVSRGDSGTFTGDFSILGDKVLARALDDRCGCAVLVKLLQSDLPCDIEAVFTVQEEIGCRGALVASGSINPDISIVIDSTTACDINDTPEDKTVCNLSKGAVVSFMDKGCAYDRELFNLIMETAESENIPAQVKRAVAGANDSASICKTAGGVKTAAISLPCRYLHTPSCMIDKNDLYSVYALILSVLKKLTEL